TAATGTLTFAPGETAKQVSVSLSGDSTDEPNEAFTLVLSGPTEATISDGSGAGTIVDDDVPVQQPPAGDPIDTDDLPDSIKIGKVCPAGKKSGKFSDDVTFASAGKATFELTAEFKEKRGKKS